MKEPIRVTTREENGIGIMELEGDVTNSAEEAMEAAYEEMNTAGLRKILLNFSKVEYINSAGLAIVIGLLSKSRKEGRELRACGLTPHFQKIFDMVGITKYVPHFETVEAALKSFSEPSADQDPSSEQ
jgi:anti-anti-sigma factor